MTPAFDVTLLLNALTTEISCHYGAYQNSGQVECLVRHFVILGQSCILAWSSL